MPSQIYNTGGQIVTPDIYFQIGMGMIPGMGSFFASGINPLVQADWETVWPTGGLYPWPDVAGTIEIASDSASDTLAGAGAQQVHIRGLDLNWILIDETVDMNGTSAVQTVNQYLRVNYIRVTQVGSNEANVGLISAIHPVEGVLQTIEPNYNSSRAAIISTPAGFNIGLLGYYASLVAPSQVSLAEVAFLAHRENQPYAVITEDLLPNPSDIDLDIRVPYFLPEKTDLEVITITDTGNRDSTIAAGFSGVYVDVNLSEFNFTGPL